MRRIFVFSFVGMLVAAAGLYACSSSSQFGHIEEGSDASRLGTLDGTAPQDGAGTEGGTTSEAGTKEAGTTSEGGTDGGGIVVVPPQDAGLLAANCNVIDASTTAFTPTVTGLAGGWESLSLQGASLGTMTGTGTDLYVFTSQGMAHYDGANWTSAAAVGGGNSSWASSTTDVWTAGLPPAATGNVNHFDGTTWCSYTATGDPAGMAATPTAAVAGVSKNDVWVGYGCDTVPCGPFLHYTGASAAGGAGPTLTFEQATLTACGSPVSMSPAGTAVVMGATGTGTKNGVCRWDGTGWAALALANALVHGTFGTSPADFWAANDQSSKGYASHWNGTTWTSTLLTGAGTASAIAGTTAANDVWIGADGIIFQYDGTKWNNVLDVQAESGVAEKFVSGWAAQHDVWFASNQGRLMHYKR
jgi:hypothetical protein